MEALNTELLKGFNYLYGRDLAVTKAVQRACEQLLEQAGFEEILPPAIVDYSHIVGETDRPVAPARSAIVLDLQTGDGEKLALSYENTIPVCIFFMKNFVGAPPRVARRFFYISVHFRNETEITSAQRLRQFHQAGFELIGGESEDTLPVAIETGSALLTNLGLNHSVRVSDATILPTVFKKLGLGPAERSALRLLYDSGDMQAFESFLACSPLGSRKKALLALLFFSRYSTRGEMCELQELLREHGLEDTLTRLERINVVLSRLPPGIRQLAALDLRVVRTARMYSGLIFQFYFGSDHECGGGGEYNRLMQSLGGPDIMACGAAFGLERIVHEYSTARKNVPSQAKVLAETPGR